MKKLYVGNLPWTTNEEELRQMFEEMGDVQSVALITDRETGRSRGFGFVEIDDAGAEKAMNELNGKDLGGRPLRVNEAQDKPRRSGGGGSGGGGGGGRW
ncbi:MAG: RNA recognition motif domain-containing protein [Acidimicrobiia bacterium]